MKIVDMLSSKVETICSLKLLQYFQCDRSLPVSHNKQVHTIIRHEASDKQLQYHLSEQ